MYRGTPRNIYRHIIISDIREAMSALPRVSDHHLFWLLFFNELTKRKLILGSCVINWKESSSVSC